MNAGASFANDLLLRTPDIVAANVAVIFFSQTSLKTISLSCRAVCFSCQMDKKSEQEDRKETLHHQVQKNVVNDGGVTS
jgi:hypothetical protein